MSRKNMRMKLEGIIGKPRERTAALKSRQWKINGQSKELSVM